MQFTLQVTASSSPPPPAILQVKKCLCVLIHHQLADFEAHKTGAFMLYRVTPGNVLLRVRFPRYIHASQLLFGDAGELIVEDILQQGQVLMSKVCNLRGG